jgi:L-iditol 2-dehydrogenase
MRQKKKPPNRWDGVEMLAFRKIAPAFGAQIARVPDAPAPGPGEALVDVAAVGVCGSDVHAYEWTPGYEFMAERLPVTLGHEFSGVVRAVGPDARGLAPGDRVACWPTVACAACSACAAARPQDCQHRAVIGLHRDGGFAERVVVPAANLRRLPAGLSLDLAALAEPLAVAINAVSVGDVGPGDRVAVLGPGPIGLAAAWVAQARGAEVLIAGMDDALRLDCARAMGLTATADLATEPLSDAVTRRFGGPADRVIEAAGVPAAVLDGLGVLRSSGVLVVAGIYARDLSLPLTRFVRMKHQLRAAHDTTDAALTGALALLAAHGEALSRMITHRLPLAQAAQGFELARTRRAVKVLLSPAQGAPDTGESA